MARILIIEDETSIRENLRRFLHLEGFTVLEAADGPAGVALATDELPDLILCDVMMPGCDGFSVLAQLQAQVATRNLRLLFLSASAEKERLQQAMEMGALGYVTKPFVIPELLALIRRHLGEN
jgi:CheY-like chemotaxis protein